VHAQLSDQSRVEVLVEGEMNLIPGQTVEMNAPAHHVHAFDKQGQRLEKDAV
jgi:hypothetical protein